MRTERRKKVHTPASMILHTKLVLPEMPGKVISRQRLVRALTDNEEKKIVMIIADAGYGKTTLISQWVRGFKWKRIFYGLSEEDSNFDLFLSHVIAGFEQIEPGLLRKVKELLRMNKGLTRDIDTVMGTLVNELENGCKEKHYLILDDFHVIRRSSIVHEALHYFIEHLPRKIHIVIASRVAPAFPSLVKWRSKQLVFELSREDLVFTSKEVKELIADVYDLSLSQGELQRIEEYTEGWVTGIQLILQSAGLRRAAVKDTLNGFLEAHQPLFDYFANEVLSFEIPSIKNFLVHSSILEKLTPEACDAILRKKNSQVILKKLEHRHLFLSKVGENEYTFHHVFQSYLLQHLVKRPEYKKLHEHAARYYRNQGFYDLCIKHYIAAEKYRQAGKMILRSIHGDIAGRVSGNIDAVRLRMFLDELPTRTLQTLPALLVTKGTLLRDSGEHERAKELYRNAEKISRASKGWTTCAHALSEMALLHWLQGRHRQALVLLKKALRACPVAERRMRLHVLNLLGLVWQDLSDLPKAKNFLRRAKNLAEELNIFYNKIVIQSNIATIFLQEGEIKKAYSACKPLIAQLGKDYYYKIGVIYANAARAALDFGDTGWAESCLEQGWSACRSYEDRVSIGTLNHAFGMYYMQKKQWRMAHRHFEEARKVFQVLRWKRMESSVVRNIGMLHRLQGDQKRSLQSIEEAEDLLKDPAPQKTAHVAFLLADRALLEIDSHDYARARKTIAQCLRKARSKGWQLGEMYGFLAKALLLRHKNHKRGMKKMIASLLNITQQKGYHGILALELKHQPELLDDMREIPDYRAYLDKHQLYQTLRQPSLYVRFFGRMRIEDRNHDELMLEWPTEKTRSLFAFMVMNRTRELTRAQVLDALWSGLNKKKAHENLRTTAYRMRRTIINAGIPGVEKELIFTLRQGRYILLPNMMIESDVDEFDHFLKLVDITRSIDEKKSALKKVIEISSEAFSSDIYDKWVDSHRSVFREQRIKALHKIILIESRQNDDHGCAEYCRQYLMLEPLSEEIACLYMTSLKRLGRLSEIKKVYQTLKKALREEVQSTPTQDTRQLYHNLME